MSPKYLLQCVINIKIVNEINYILFFLLVFEYSAYFISPGLTPFNFLAMSS